MSDQKSNIVWREAVPPGAPCSKAPCAGWWAAVRGKDDRRGWLPVCTKEGCEHTAQAFDLNDGAGNVDLNDGPSDAA